MRVELTPREKPRLLFFHLPAKMELSAKIEFDEFERYLVERYQLGNFLLVACRPVITHDSAGCPIGQADNNVYLNFFLPKGQAAFPFSKPSEARLFAEELRRGFEKLQKELIENGSELETLEWSFPTQEEFTHVK